MGSIALPASGSDQQIVAWQLCFGTNRDAGAKVVRKFTEPRDSIVTGSKLILSALPERVWPEPIDYCWVLFLPQLLREKKSHFEMWMAPLNEAGAAPTVVVERDGEIIRWRPGQVVVQCTPDREEDILSLLCECCFYESELRAQEAGVRARQTQAEADVSIAYRIQRQDRNQWDRFQESIEYFARTRLAYARLAPLLVNGSRTLPSSSQRIVATLFRDIHVDARLEALNDQLEVMEELYEGANDRVADYRWYHSGTWLEIGIVILLVLETIMIAIDVFYIHRR